MVRGDPDCAVAWLERGHGSTFLWGLRGVLKGVKSSAQEILENQKKSGEFSLL